MYYDEYSACNYCLKESTGVKVRRNKTLQNTITNTMIGCMLTKTIILKYIYYFSMSRGNFWTLVERRKRKINCVY